MHLAGAWILLRFDMSGNINPAFLRSNSSTTGLVSYSTGPLQCILSNRGCVEHKEPRKAAWLCQDSAGSDLPQSTSESCSILVAYEVCSPCSRAYRRSFYRLCSCLLLGCRADNFAYISLQKLQLVTPRTTSTKLGAFFCRWQLPLTSLCTSLTSKGA